VFSTACFTVVVIALLQLHPSICFELFCQCRLAVCIVNSIQFLSGHSAGGDSSSITAIQQRDSLLDVNQVSWHGAAISGGMALEE